MNKLPAPRTVDLTRRLTLPIAVAVMAVVPACTDLGESPLSALTPDTFYRTEDEVMGGMAAVYAQLRSSLGAYYDLSEVTSDEFIVPTRGPDWGDGGKWIQMHQHEWTPINAAGLNEINNAWQDMFTGIARANVLLAAMENVEVEGEEGVVAEVRTLRALYYYMLMDLYGGVPIVTGTEIMPRARNTRAEVFDFIETELLAARPALPVTWSAEMNGRMTQGAVDAILASMYLNAEVFTGEVTASGLQRGEARWDDAVEAADRILNSEAGYTLAADWKSNFTPDNHLSPEIILAVKHIAQTDLGFTYVMRGLHYNQITPTPWNGFATVAETYYAFDQDDQRFEIFLEGQGFNVETGQPVNDRAGEPLFFTPEIGDITQAAENEGVRIYKWPYDPDHVAQFHGNDYALFRLAEIMLIKAEALNELGQTDDALALVNEVRERVFDPDEPLTGTYTVETMRDAILAERLFELTAEAKRRQDLIRHDQYTQGVWSFKEPSEPYRVLMPISQTQLDANPLLVQNAGY